MADLKVFADHDPSAPILHSRDKGEIARALSSIGVRYEQWTLPVPVAPGTPADAVIAAYRPYIDKLVAEQGYQAVDVVSLASDHPDRAALRAKFLSEHTHGEDEVRFFVSGSGLFSLHVGEKVYEVLCTQGDLISVPAGATHWFDMGPRPSFVAIRLFNNPEGWVARFTGSPIAERFSRYEG